MGAEDDLLKKYKDVINKNLNKDEINQDKVIRSSEFSQFKEQFKIKTSSFYERSCKLCEPFGFSPSPNITKQLESSISYCKLNVTPKGVMAFAVIFPLVFATAGILITFALWQSFFYIIVFSGLFMALIYPFMTIPITMARSRRLRASNQMVLSVFYIVTYMRHTSNLELAVNFAAEHLGPPLSTDFNTIIWDVESGKYPSIKEALDTYLEDWKKDAMEFVESMHLIESSIFESEEERRITLLDKSLQVMLEETYEKMIHYAHSLQSPISMLHMLGIILPILGLVILPLAVNFMSGIEWFHILAIYDIFLPAAVFYLGWKVLSQRPSGGGSSDAAIENNPELKKYQKLLIKVGKKEYTMSPAFPCFLIFIVLFLLALSPIFLHPFTVKDNRQEWDFGMVASSQSAKCPDFSPAPEGQSKPDPWINCKFRLLDYRISKSQDSSYRNYQKLIGPFGILSALISLLFPLSLALSFGLYFRIKSYRLIDLRNRSKKLEGEFSQGLFQLGSRLGDGIPVELAFGRVAEVMEGTTTGDFFSHVSNNIMQIGMGVHDAIFNPVNGALVSYPSSVIESSMKVLVESAKKGPLIAAQAVLNVSDYIKEMHRVEERLRDLMAETTSSMKSQISFMTPAITGIVIGITSMVTTIMGNLTTSMNKLGSKTGGSPGGLDSILGGDGMPTYFFQMIVGIYVVEVTYILTVLSNGIINGSDRLQEEYEAGKNLIRATILYCIIAFAIMVLFNMIATQIMGSMANK